MTVSQRVTDVTFRRPQAAIGVRGTSSDLDVTKTLLNDAGQAKQVSTVTVAAATNDKVYTITVNGIDVSYTSDGSATTAEVASGLADAVNAEPLVRGQVSASAATNVATLTGLMSGVSFTLTEADAQLSVATSTTAASAETVPFGRYMVATGWVSESAAYHQDGEATEQGALVQESTFSAQVDTVDTPYIASAAYLLTVSVEGQSYAVSVAADTDTPTTGTAVAAAINAILPANTVVAAGVAGGLTLTAEKEGLSFSTTIGASDGGASMPAVAIASTRSISTSLEDAGGAVSLFSSQEENLTVAPDGGDAVYKANVGVRAMAKGSIWVESSEAPSASDAVYVETAAGATQGRFYTSGSATRILLPRSMARWVRDARPSSGIDLALLYIDAL